MAEREVMWDPALVAMLAEAKPATAKPEDEIVWDPPVAKGGELIGTTGIAKMFGITPQLANNWVRHWSFPLPETPWDVRSKWDSLAVEAWAVANWRTRPTLRPWAAKQGLCLPEGPRVVGGVPAEKWDISAPLRKSDIARLLGLRSTNNGRIVYRRDFPHPIMRKPERWDPVEVREWALGHLHLKSLVGWCEQENRSKHTMSREEVMQMLEIATVVDFQTFLRKDPSFPSPSRFGFWDTEDIETWLLYRDYG